MTIYSPSQVKQMIAAGAVARNIDPGTALRVFNQESGFNVFNNNLTSREKSYGVFQLNTQGGLGNEALAAGINVRDPNTFPQQLDFSLDHVQAKGWGAWYGARDTGVSAWEGIGGRPTRYSSPTANALAGKAGPGAGDTTSPAFNQGDTAKGTMQPDGTIAKPGDKVDQSFGGLPNNTNMTAGNIQQIIDGDAIARAIKEQTKTMSETEKADTEALNKAAGERQKGWTQSVTDWYKDLKTRSSDYFVRIGFIIAGMAIIWAAFQYLGLGRTITQAIPSPKSI